MESRFRSRQMGWVVAWLLALVIAVLAARVVVDNQYHYGIGGAGNPVKEHRVTRGETLSELARVYNTSVRVLVRINHIANPDLIRVGQVLKIPVSQNLLPRNTAGLSVPASKAVVYNVQPGDTLAKIAHRYGVPLAAVVAVNSIQDPNYIVPGEKIEVPVDFDNLSSHSPGAMRTQMAMAKSRLQAAQKTSGKVAVASRKQLSWPLPVAGVITSGFGMRWGSLHTGVDIGVPVGTSVKAAAGGRVKLANRLGSYGRTVIIRHNGSLETLYAHLSKIEVKAGQQVSTGQEIGRSGDSGHSTGPHLHFEVIVHGHPVPPLQYVQQP